jgi:hypothetical protein
MDEKVFTNYVFPILLAIFTYFLGLSSNLAAKLYRDWLLRRNLRREIDESRSYILRNIQTFECMIQLSIHRELANVGPMPIPIQVHAEHFPEINLRLSSTERFSVNAIYHLLHTINSSIQELHNIGPECRRDPGRFSDLASSLDTSYHNCKHALLLATLHTNKRRHLKDIMESGEGDRLVKDMRQQIHQDLVRLAGEAKSLKATEIRSKHDDGPSTLSEVRRTGPPQLGRFYFDFTGTKYKCIATSDEHVTLMILEQTVGPITIDAVVKQPAAELRHLFEIRDNAEIERLERRISSLRGDTPHRPKG